MQEHLKIAYSRKALETFGAVEKRDIADVFQTDFTDVAAVVVTDEDGDALRNPRIHAFEIPVFLILSVAGKKHDELIGQAYSIIDPTDGDHPMRHPHCRDRRGMYSHRRNRKKRGLPDVYERKHRLGGRGSRTGNIRFQHTSLSL